jgi:hypothetical protein
VKALALQELVEQKINPLEEARKQRRDRERKRDAHKDGHQDYLSRLRRSLYRRAGSRLDEPCLPATIQSYLTKPETPKRRQLPRKPRESVPVEPRTAKGVAQLKQLLDTEPLKD